MPQAIALTKKFESLYEEERDLVCQFFFTDVFSFGEFASGLRVIVGVSHIKNISYDDDEMFGITYQLMKEGMIVDLKKLYKKYTSFPLRFISVNYFRRDAQYGLSLLTKHVKRNIKKVIVQHMQPYVTENTTIEVQMCRYMSFI